MAMLPKALPYFSILPKYHHYLLRQSIPIARNRHVSGIAQCEHDIRKADRIAVAQQELGIAVHADRIYTIVVPITYHRLVTRQPIVQSYIRKAAGIQVL